MRSIVSHSHLLASSHTALCVLKVAFALAPRKAHLLDVASHALRIELNRVESNEAFIYFHWLPIHRRRGEARCQLIDTDMHIQHTAWRNARTVQTIFLEDNGEGEKPHLIHFYFFKRLDCRGVTFSYRFILSMVQINDGWNAQKWVCILISSFRSLIFTVHSTSSFNSYAVKRTTTYDGR